MAKSKNTKGVTAVGEALFAHILKTEVFSKPGMPEQDTGKFTIMLKLSEPEKKKLLKQIDAEWEKFKSSPAVNGKKLKYDYSNGLKSYKDEDYFKFGMKEHFVLKSGKTIHRTVPVFDCDNKEISKTLTSIGNGSKVRVAYELVPFFMSDKNYGISLRLDALQLVELVEYGGADSFGFEKAEGFVANAAEETSEDDVPFVDSSEAPKPEDDF